MHHSITSNENIFSQDEAFDSITELASFLLNVPVSLVSIIDSKNDRQVFKSQMGLNEPWSSKGETPLSHSFCQHVASRDAMLCVENSRTHDLVKDSLAIPELGVVAYLGTPVRNEFGHAIGAFCVISGEEKNWTDRDKEIVSRLASCVTELIKKDAYIRALSLETKRSHEQSQGMLNHTSKEEPLIAQA